MKCKRCQCALPDTPWRNLCSWCVIALTIEEADTQEDTPNLADQHDGECDCGSCDQERHDDLSQKDTP